jgi:hypothetical protein
MRIASYFSQKLKEYEGDICFCVKNNLSLLINNFILGVSSIGDFDPY